MREKSNANRNSKNSETNIKIANIQSNLNKPSQTDEAMKKMIKISIICTFFLFAEIIGGIIANSLAILTDAAHLTSDLSGFIISIIAIYIGKKKPDKVYTFGYYRAEVLGALVSVITIWILTVLLIQEAIERIINPSEIYVPVMLLTAIIGLISNLAMMNVLHSGGHSHGNCNHSHSHGLHLHTDEGATELINDSHLVHNKSMIEINLEDSRVNSLNLEEKGENKNNQSKEWDKHDLTHEDHIHSEDHHIDHSDHKDYHYDHSDHHHDHHSENVNIRAALIHIIGDIIQSIGVVIASLIVYFKPEWKIVDPICTFVFSIIVLFTTFNITKQCIAILMEASPLHLRNTNIGEMIKFKVFIFLFI